MAPSARWAAFTAASRLSVDRAVTRGTLELISENVEPAIVVINKLNHLVLRDH